MGLSSSKQPHLLNLQGFPYGEVFIGQTALTYAEITMFVLPVFFLDSFHSWKTEKIQLLL